MMELPVNKELQYFSPTSFMQAEECELSFWILRLSGYDFPQQPQTIQMAVGSAFDSFVKAELAFILGKDKSKYLLAELLKTVGPPEAVAEGNRLFQEYRSQGCLKRLLNDGLTDIELEEKKLVHGKEIEGTGKFLGQIAIFCKPDAMLGNGTPVDWKVNGFQSRTGATVHSGYLRRVCQGYDSGPSEVQTLLESIDKKWAIQMLFYNWISNGPRVGHIEQVAIKPNKLEFISYQASIGQSFEEELIVSLQDKWERFRLEKAKLHRPNPTSSLCEPFNNPKMCTLVCPEYAKSIGDPVKRRILKA